jgi:hypothetical protein
LAVRVCASRRCWCAVVGKVTIRWPRPTATRGC